MRVFMWQDLYLTALCLNLRSLRTLKNRSMWGMRYLIMRLRDAFAGIILDMEQCGGEDHGF